MQRGDEKGRKLDNWIFAAIFILGIIISPWHHSWDLGIMQLVIVCACWMLKIRMSQRFAITLDTPRIYHYFYLVLSQYQPAQPSAQPTHAPTHKQVCIAAENICSLYLRRSISRLWDQSSWLIKCFSCVNIHDLKRNEQCVQIVNESLRLCLINAANSKRKKVISV